MNSALDELIAKAYTTSGDQADVNKVYLELLKTTLYLPIEKSAIKSEVSATTEPFKPLFVYEGELIFMAAFDSLEKFQSWAGEFFDEMDYVTMVGRDVIGGIGEKVYLSLNPGSPYYKEFSPDEMTRLKAMVQKILQWKKN